MFANKLPWLNSPPLLEPPKIVGYDTFLGSVGLLFCCFCSLIFFKGYFWVAGGFIEGNNVAGFNSVYFFYFYVFLGCTFKLTSTLYAKLLADGANKFPKELTGLVVNAYGFGCAGAFVTVTVRIVLSGACRS